MKRENPRGPNLYERDIRLDNFADEYIKTGNATKAVLKAGYTTTEASALGTKLLRHPRVQSRLDYLRRRALKKAGVSAEWVIEELTKIAKADLGDILYFDDDGKIHIRPEALEDPEVSAAISELTIDDEGFIKGDKKIIRRKGRVRLHDKTKALIEIGKHFGLWPAARGEGFSEPGQAGVEIRITGGLPVRKQDIKIEDAESED